jgi:pimeloyl-ACP methyl ester carboxylesterase
VVGVVKGALVLAMIAGCAAGSVGRYAEIGPLHMYYEEAGEGRPLVLLHGGGSTVETTFGRILPLLAHGHHVIAPEQQGHGHTSDLDRPLSFEQMADDTAALLTQLGIHDADVLGFSNGGMVALQLAIRHPALVHRLILCSSFYARDGAIPPLREAWAQPPDAAKMPPPLRDGYLATAPHPDLQGFVAKTIAMMQTFSDIPEATLRTITVPVLVMIGDHDVIRTEHALRLSQLVPHGQLAVFPGSIHGTYLGAAEGIQPGAPPPTIAATWIERFLTAS